MSAAAEGVVVAEQVVSRQFTVVRESERKREGVHAASLADKGV
jgi:hypothetical protein